VSAKIRPVYRPWYVEAYYAIGRGFGHLFRLSWYGKGPGVWSECEACEGFGRVIIPWMIPEKSPHVNALPCRSCAGLGKIFRTDGVL
jgi:hypothetical protein